MILHITNDFSGSAVYKHLFLEIDELGITQTVYHPLRNPDNVGGNFINFKTNGSKVHYRAILNNSIDKLLYKSKIKKIFDDLIYNVDLSDVKLIHAHTWYSDGGVAYYLNQKFNIPYIVAIRSSDVEYFYRYLIWERNFAMKILKNAQKIIFISESYREKMKEKFSDEISTKVVTVPNGIDKFWIENASIDALQKFPKNSIEKTFNILYVGQFIKRKNVDKLIDAVLLLNSSGVKVKLDLVGGTGEQFSNSYDAYTFINFHGKIKEKLSLLDIYRKSHVFAMPSINETFGLVYIEALSQSLPLLYTRHDGIDGIYEGIGEAVTKPVVVSEIFDKLRLIYENYSTFKIDVKQICNNHDWSKIAYTYKEIYNQIQNSI